MMKAVSSPVAMVLQQRWVTSYLRIGVVGKRPRRSSVKSYYLLRPKAETKTKASHTQWLKITKLSLIMDKLTEFNQWVLLFETLETWWHLALKITDYFFNTRPFLIFSKPLCFRCFNKMMMLSTSLQQKEKKEFSNPYHYRWPPILIPFTRSSAGLCWCSVKNQG